MSFSFCCNLKGQSQKQDPYLYFDKSKQYSIFEGQTFPSYPSKIWRHCGLSCTKSTRIEGKSKGSVYTLRLLFLFIYEPESRCFLYCRTLGEKQMLWSHVLMHWISFIFLLGFQEFSSKNSPLSCQKISILQFFFLLCLVSFQTSPQWFLFHYKKPHIFFSWVNLSSPWVLNIFVDMYQVGTKISSHFLYFADSELYPKI